VTKRKSTKRKSAKRRSIDVVVNLGVDHRGVDCYIIGLDTQDFSISIWVPSRDIEKLKEAGATEWGENRSLRLGKCAGKSVLWCAGERGTIGMMIGDDEESYDIAGTLPGDTIDRIFRDIKEQASEDA